MNCPPPITPKLTNTAMHYTAEDMSITLPDTTMEDLSMNVLKFPALGTTLVITRGVIAKGLTLAQSFDAQIKKLQQQSRDFKSQGRKEINIGAQGEIAAVEIEHQLLRGQETLWQYQLACQLPEAGAVTAPEAAGKMLALSYVKNAPLGEQEREHWEFLKTSLRFTGP